MTQKPQRLGLTSLSLHLLAMFLMLCDHVWATVASDQAWLTALGRLAFPMFAFLLAEGFRRTHSVKRYAQRLLVLAVISEVPFDLMYGGTVFYPFHQNVIWTFLIALLAMWAISAAQRAGKPPLTLVVCVAAAAAGWLAGRLCMTDYGGEGVLTVLLFYLFPGSTWRQRLCQAAGMVWLNCVLLVSLVLPVTVFGLALELPEQGLAVLALLPIWLYNGRQGTHNRVTRLLCYGFYPVHMLLLALCMCYL